METIVNISLPDMAHALLKFIDSYDFRAGKYDLQDARLLYSAAEVIKRNAEKREDAQTIK